MPNSRVMNALNLSKLWFDKEAYEGSVDAELMLLVVFGLHSLLSRSHNILALRRFQQGNSVR